MLTHPILNTLGLSVSIILFQNKEQLISTTSSFSVLKLSEITSFSDPIVEKRAA